MAQINFTAILQKLVVALPKDKRLENLSYGAALGRVRFYKHQLIYGEKGFLNHPITKEILDGPKADSNFIPDGNLHSFIGFHEGSEAGEQINAVKSLLEAEIDVQRPPSQKILKKNGVITKFKVKVPFLKDIWALTPYPQPPPGNIARTGSWMDAIEMRGINGFEHYLYLWAQGKTSTKSRSGTGLQIVKKSFTSASMSPVDYMRKLLNNFKQKVNV